MISRENLEQQANEYAQQRDNLLKQADAMKKQAAKLIDDANTAHGAYLAVNRVIEDLTTHEVTPKTKKADKDKKS